MIKFNIERGDKTPFTENQATFISNNDVNEQVQVFKHLSLPVTIIGVYKSRGLNVNQLFISDNANKILFKDSQLTVGYDGNGPHNFKDALNNIPGIEGDTNIVLKTQYDEKGVNYNGSQGDTYSVEIHVL